MILNKLIFMFFLMNDNFKQKNDDFRHTFDKYV